MYNTRKISTNLIILSDKHIISFNNELYNFVKININEIEILDENLYIDYSDFIK